MAARRQDSRQRVVMPGGQEAAGGIRAGHEAGAGEVAHAAVVAAVLMPDLLAGDGVMAGHGRGVVTVIHGDGHGLTLAMGTQRHGQAGHGLHRQPERGKHQQESGEATVHGAQVTPGCLPMQAGTRDRRHQETVPMVPCGISDSRMGLAPAETLRRAVNTDSLPSAYQVEKLKLKCPPGPDGGRRSPIRIC